MSEHRIYETSFSEVYPHYVSKLTRKGRDIAQLATVIEWLTGFDETSVKYHLDAKTTFRDFFAAASINPNAELITGRICGISIQEIDDPLMKQIRYLDKLVDELGNGRAIDKILRSTT